LGTVKTLPPRKGDPPPIVRLNRPAMESTDVNLNELLACCKRELAFRERCYPRWVARGTISEAKAAKELELMRLCVEYFVDAVFRAVTQRKP
jgi:hypothetical protein